MMIKRGTVFISLVILLLLIGCANKVQVSEALPEPVKEETTVIMEETTTVSKDLQPTESETLPTDTVTQKQDVTPTVQNPACSRTFSPQFNAEPYYSGLLFDAHFHMPPTWQEEDEGWRPPVRGKEVTLEQLLCNFDKEKVKGAITFNLWEYENQEQSIQDLAEMKKKVPAGIHLFLIPSELKASELDDLINKHPGVFDGFGEITHYSPERPGQTPDDPESMEMYKVAAKHGFVIMFHPDENQKSKIEHALQSNPQVKFLLHGWESADYISELMDKYPNLYYSVDSATLYAFDGMLIKGPGDRFISRFKSDFNSQLKSKTDKWKTQIEKHPDRFMWGTDRAADWHFDDEISSLFEEFGRAFIGRLSPEVQEKYAYKNAEKLFQS